jgi:predicted AAA+ superfamily ATPase
VPAKLLRNAEKAVVAALQDTRVVLVNGARQAGKSTLVKKVLKTHERARWRTLDDGVTLAAARADPARFVQHDELLAIDEIQRAPELMLAIKAAVDRDERPGGFLLTGSARVLGLKALPDSLVGRMETVELWPFSQGELEARVDRFVDTVFDDEPRFPDGTVGRDELIERLTRGGFPEATRRDASRRAKFFEAYAHDLVERDVSQLSDVPRREGLHHLLRVAAALPAQLLKVERVASDAGIPARSAERYLSLFEEVFLIKRLPAWSNRTTTRAVRMRKLLFVDTGLCAHLQRRNLKRLLRDDSLVGPLLENFVLSELARQLGWSTVSATLAHYRTRDGVEVDGVLENADGRLVGVEVKAAATVRAEDFAGLRHLAAHAGERFHQGVVLYTGKDALPFGKRMTAVPIDALWRA